MSFYKPDREVELFRICVKQLLQGCVQFVVQKSPVGSLYVMTITIPFNVQKFRLRIELPDTKSETCALAESMLIDYAATNLMSYISTWRFSNDRENY